jgi:uncharacterized membrane protein
MIDCMSTLSIIFFVGGLLVTLAGVVMVFLARFEPRTTESVTDLKDLLKEFNELLKLVQEKYRIGVVIMAVGLALVGVGAWLEARDAKDEAKKTAMAALVVHT